jgi:hypothetical protein
MRTHLTVVGILSPGEGTGLEGMERPAAGRVPCLRRKGQRPVCRVGHGTSRQAGAAGWGGLRSFLECWIIRR